MPHLRGEGRRGWCQKEGTSKGFNQNKIPQESSYIQSFLSQAQPLKELGGGASEPGVLGWPGRMLLAEPGPGHRLLVSSAHKILTFKEWRSSFSRQGRVTLGDFLLQG